ncbi:MAG: hydrogenase expression/formation protein HypE [Candidatus Omnitrophota bacterium]
MKEERISLKHGEGTRQAYELIQDVFLTRIKNPALEELADAASVDSLAYTCDSFTVSPIFFPASDIGKLSVCGTVNDLCVSAAVPLYLSLAVIIEEGFLKKDLERIVDSIGREARNSRVKIVTGDFKVVEKGKVDKIFISTSGIGKKIPKRSSAFRNIQHKDKIIVTGSIGEHGISVMLARNKIFDFDITSDCQGLADVVIPLWERFPAIRFMRDPTRGGIASTFNEIYLGSKMGVKIIEENVPVRKDLHTACEILGIDPYYLACEGRAIIVVSPKAASEVLRFLKKYSPAAAIIGECDRNIKGVMMKTIAGGERILDFSHSFNLPRIC